MTNEERAELTARLQRMKDMKMPEGFFLHVGTLLNRPGLYAKEQIAAGIANDIVNVVRAYSEEFDFDFDYAFLLEINKEVDEEIKRRLTLNDNSSV